MMPRRRALVAMAALAAEAVAVIVAAPAARATDPNGFAPSILTKTFTVAAGQRADGISVLCPAGTTPIAGGLRTDPATTVHYKDYINWGTGKGFAAAVDNPTDSDVAGTAYVRCVDAAWLTATSRVVATFAENNSTHHTGGYTRCPSGSYALSARVDWNSTIGKQSIDYSGPTWDMRSWVVAGTNAGTGNYMFVDVQCVSTSSLPGAYLVHTQQENTTYASKTITLTTTCPDAMVPINGGSFTQRNGDYQDFSSYIGTVHASYPTDTGWVAEATVPGKSFFDDYIMYATTWCIPDQKPPVLQVDRRPDKSTNISPAAFTFYATDPDAPLGHTLSFQCSIDGGPLTACTSPWAPTVTEGYHAATIEATTSDGRSASDTYHWTYDKTAPTATMLDPTAPFTLAMGVPVDWTGDDGIGVGVGVAGFGVRYRTAAYTDPSFGKFRHPSGVIGGSFLRVDPAAGVTYCYSAQAMDRAGNLSPWSAPACLARPVDDGILTASSGWTTRQGSAAVNGTYRHTTVHNATLALAGVTLDRVGIVATTCPGCGKVAILIAGTQVGTINLAASTTYHRVILALPQFSPRTGAVVIRVISTGKPVDIDGLATSHA